MSDLLERALHRYPGKMYRGASELRGSLLAVSYTHLTLPTSDLV